MANETLIPVRHEEVAVCGEYVLAAVTEDGKAYFSPRHVCDALGIDWKSQHVKIKADPVLSSTVVEITTVAADSKNRKQTMLPIEFANGWLFTIKKVRPELQAKLNLFRAEAFLALDAWFRQGLRKDDENVQRRVTSPAFLREMADVIEKKDRELAEARPSITFHERCTYKKTLWTISMAAKELGVTLSHLQVVLLRNGVLQQRGKRYWPREGYIHKGYFEVIPECNYGFTPGGLELARDLIKGNHHAAA